MKNDLNDNTERLEGHQEERKGGDKPRYEKVSIYNWDKSKITLETPIPEKPKEKDLVKEPKREELNKKVDEVERQMENLKNKKN